MGASLSIGLPDLGFLTTGGASIRKRVPMLGRCIRPFPLQEFGERDWMATAGPKGETSLLRKSAYCQAPNSARD